MPRPLLALLLCLAIPAASQNPDVADKEAARRAKQAEAQKKEAAAAEQSEKFTAEGEDVAYDAVRAKPDDVALNYRYALTQIRHGDLKGASATLERILLIDPGLPRVRYFYALVLMRMDNLVEAERELATLLGQNPPAEVKEEAEKALKEVRKRRKRTHLTIRAGAGFQYDSNRNASPADGTRLFAGVPLPVTGSGRRDDTSLIGLASVDAKHDLNTPAGHQLIAGMDYYRAEQTLLKSLNLAAYSFNAGGVYRSRWVTLTPRVLFDHVQLAQTTFLRSRGGQLRADKRLGRSGELHASVRSMRQVYNNTALIPAAEERTGVMVDAVAGGSALVTPTMRLGADFNYAVKHAQLDSNKYFRTGGALHHTWLTGQGTFLLSDFAVNMDRYPVPDLFISRDRREDTIYSADFTFGAPLSLVAKPLSDLLLTASYGWYQADSNLSNFAYTNNKASVMLTYKWEIGL